MPGDSPAARGAGLSVLVVDDNRDAADSLRMLLEAYGHQVAVAYTGPDGVRVAAEYQPEVVAVENVFLAKNAMSALKLGQARGAAIVAAVNVGLPVHEYTAMQVKQAVVGTGRAEKTQVQQMIKALLNLPEVAQEDASDALAVAICHAHSAGISTLLKSIR